MTVMSRRTFLAVTAAGASVAGGIAAPLAQRAETTLTAEAIVERIKAGAGVAPVANTVDAFKAGSPSTVVRGVATTAMATMDVLRQAVAKGANLIVTCEPTFYSRSDSLAIGSRAGAARAAGAPPDDRLVRAKAEFIDRNNLVVWRFSDLWRRRTPDPFARGLVDAFGWTPSAQANAARVVVPETSLDRLVSHVERTLKPRGGMRVVGKGGTRLRTVAVLPGTTAIAAAVTAFADADVIIAGEVREWETVEYARDLVAAGERKALILLGRVLSEERGMSVCAEWLRATVPEVTTTWIPVGDPYWTPR